MKLIVAVFVVTALAYAYAETCTESHQCTGQIHTLCHNHTHIVCKDNICHCSLGPSGACVALADCSQQSCPAHNGNQHTAHCIDGHCHCLRPQGGGQGGHPPQNN